MNSAVMTTLEAPPVAPDPRRLIVPVGLGLLLLGALFSSEVVAAVHTWMNSTAYNHCFLVIPIALYLIWERWGTLSGIPMRPMPAAALLCLPVGAVWLVAERLGIMEGRQFAAVGLAELLFLAVMGKRLWWALSGPLLYLYFLVPFGEFLTPRLQDITTFFVRHGLNVLGVPAYIDGYIIEIPQGTFYVAEACAGLRFLIASIAFGWLYALLMYRSPVRRGVFILASLTVPVFANGLRAIGIVYLGYLLGSAQAAAADHIIYGWIFFSLVILMLIALGLPFRQDEMPATSPVRLRKQDMRRKWRDMWGGSGMILATLAVIAVSALAPAVAAVLTSGAHPPTLAADVIAFGPGCDVRPEAPMSGVRAERVTCGDVAMDVTWQAFSPRVTAGPVMAARRRLSLRTETESHAEDWLVTPDHARSPWRIMSSTDPVYLMAVAVWVDGVAVRPGLPMRARMAMDSLLGASHAPMVVTVAPAVDWAAQPPGISADLRDRLTVFLRDHPDLLNTVGALSRLHR